MAKIKSFLLAEQVYEILREKIINREYHPGEKLDIYKLSDEFGVSRSPIKEAINQLEYDGLIEIIPRKGTYVTEINLNSLMEALDARLMVELWAAKEIIHTVPASKVEKWGQIVQQMDDLLKQTPFAFQTYNKADMKFHDTIIEWAGNKTITEFFSSLNAHVALSRIVQSTSLESTKKRHADHWKLYHAMEERNYAAFSNAITSHIESIKKEASTLFEEME
ncbi:GntR family transcriptional regulator [Oceanobacillus senegalensis]|uniref:GntR family transcriptional regulator n=1 Tax=Oceanobacillus senegalensis TaxID=1936063 RepID=UPI000A314094|nr:GntR family transcriptional regulator [Oceanobacillus senegalensis]